MKISLICTCKCDWIAGWTWETEASYQASTIKSLYDPPMNMKLVRVTLHFLMRGGGGGGGGVTHTHKPSPPHGCNWSRQQLARPAWLTDNNSPNCPHQTLHRRVPVSCTGKEKAGGKKKKLERTWINQPFWFRGSPWKALICSCWHVACAAWAHWEVRHQLTQYTHVIEL